MHPARSSPWGYYSRPWVVNPQPLFLTCPVCLVEFQSHPNWVERGRLACSATCHVIGLMLRHTEMNIHGHSIR